MNLTAISELLLNLGLAPHLRGMWYLRYMLSIYRPGMMLTKELYPAAAEYYNVTPTRVERSCRHALDFMLKYGDNALQREVLGFAATNCVTVGMFLAACFLYLQGYAGDVA